MRLAGCPSGPGHLSPQDEGQGGAQARDFTRDLADCRLAGDTWLGAPFLLLLFTTCLTGARLRATHEDSACLMSVFDCFAMFLCFAQ